MKTYRLFLRIVYFLCILIILISCKDDEILPPLSPQGVSAAAGESSVTISWNVSQGALSYNIYWSESTGVTITNGTLISNATSPHTHTGLSLGTTYYYIVTAVNEAGEGTSSSEVSATIPSLIPQNVSANSGEGEVTVSWDNISGASTYNIYWSENAGVTTTNGTLISNVTSPHSHTGLTFGTTYYYIVTATNSAGESDPSNEVNAAINPSEIMFQSVITTPGSRNADVWGVESGGNEYAIIGDFSSSRNVSFINVTDPLNPQIVSVVDNVLGWDMKVFGNHVYVANFGLTSGPDSLSTIINISDISNPQVVGTFPAAHSTWVDDQGYLYISGGGPNVRIYNLNPDPVNPTLVWEDMTGEASHDIAVIRGRLYDFHRYSGTFIYDVSNPENPVLIGFVDYIGEIPGSSGDERFAFNHNGWVTDDDRYLFITDEKRFGDGPGIVIYDISNLSQISRVGEILVAGARSHNIYIVNNLAYVSHYGDGFHVYDVSNPRKPVLLDKYNTNLNNTDAENGFLGAFGVYPFATSGNIYVSDMNNDLFVFKVE